MRLEVSTTRPNPATRASKGSVLEVVSKRLGRGKLGIQVRLFLLQAVVVLVLTLALAIVQGVVLERSIQRDYGERALGISRLVATMPDLVDAIEHSNHPSASINPLANRIRGLVGADFIVVGDVHGIRLSHPNPAKLGHSMYDSAEPRADTDQPLAGVEIISIAKGGLGVSIRGKVPIFNAQKHVIGLVSTGYLLPGIQQIAARVSSSIYPWFGLALGLALLSSIIIARRFKLEMLNLEPEQISALVLEHRAVLSALQEGVLVLDAAGKVLLANPRAAQMLDLQESEHVSISSLWAELFESGLLANSSQAQNQALRLNGLPVLVNVLEAADGRRVVTFRDRAEITQIAEELTQTRQYSDLLRAQTHEFMNRLHTISGLIQLERKDDALNLIHLESERARVMRDLISEIQVPHLAALIIGKVERARELGVHFGLEPGANLGSEWTALAADVLVPVIGNLIENAFESVLETSKNPSVTLAIGTDPEGLQLEVIDNGAGVPESSRQHIFEPGFSSHGATRGLGLAMVKQHVNALGGSVTCFERASKTVFQVSLPHSSLAPLRAAS